MTDNYQDPAVGARAHFNGGFLGTQLTDVSQKIFSTAEGGTFSTRNVGEILGIGEYPKNTEAFPLAIANTFDSLAVDAGVKCIIYSGQNFSGDVLLEKTGPFVIYNYFMRHFQGGSFDPSIAPLWVDSEEVPQQPGVTYGELFPAEVRTWDAAIGGNMHNWSSGSMKLVAVEESIATDGNYQDPGATASDAEDGDITHKIVKTITKTTTFQGSTFEAPVDNIPLDSEGAYTINYSVTDSAGVSATNSRKVNVSANSFNLEDFYPPFASPCDSTITEYTPCDSSIPDAPTDEKVEDVIAGTTWFFINGTRCGEKVSHPSLRIGGAASNAYATAWSSPGGFNGFKLNFHPTRRVSPTPPANCGLEWYTPTATRYPPCESTPCAPGNNDFVASPFINGWYGQVTFNQNGTYEAWFADKDDKVFETGESQGNFVTSGKNVSITIPKSSGTQTLTMFDVTSTKLEVSCSNVRGFVFPNLDFEVVTAVRLLDSRDHFSKPSGTGVGMGALRWDTTEAKMPFHGTDVITS